MREDVVRGDGQPQSRITHHVSLICKRAFPVKGACAGTYPYRSHTEKSDSIVLANRFASGVVCHA